MSITKCRLIELPQVADPRGNLTFIQNDLEIPFTIKRVYYSYDITSGAVRGGHGHKKLEQLIIPVSGSFDIVLDDGFNKKTFTMNRPYMGLYVCPMMWREINNFSSGSVCLVLASTLYDEADYYRDYNQFIIAARNQQ